MKEDRNVLRGIMVLINDKFVGDVILMIEDFIDNFSLHCYDWNEYKKQINILKLIFSLSALWVFTQYSNIFTPSLNSSLTCLLHKTNALGLVDL